MSVAEERPPPAPPHHQGIPNHVEACREDVEHEPSLPQRVYGENRVYDGFLHGRESSIEGDSSEGGCRALIHRAKMTSC
jgi:hypothetical protein